MALTFEIDDNRAISLEEYVSYVRSNVDTNEIDSIAASAPMFRRLLNNRELITDKVNQDLRVWRDFQSGNTYTAQTLLLWMDETFFVRANVWTPPSVHRSVAEKEQDLFFYGRAHDHNFTFMTGGYLGSGYETHIFEYDPSAVNGERYQRLDLQFLETTRLPTGKIMVYRESRDIHEQGYPEDYSISLNLMTQREAKLMPRARQLFFDLSSGTVTDAIDTEGGRAMMTSIAKLVGDATTASLLADICETHPSVSVRAQAFDALASLEPGRRDEVAAWRARDAALPDGALCR